MARSTDQPAPRDLLRVVTCGSVDDGKSTLIGRLIADTGSLSDDQMRALEQLSKRYGTTGDEIDYALLVDGLQAEREQGITIDVAYRYFGSPKRAFIIADTPGHEQYTQNMVTGASNAELALVLVDVRAGLTAQTMRHIRLLALLGIRAVLLTVNKMDLVGFSESAFEEIKRSCLAFAAELHFSSIMVLPVSARSGDNVSTPSDRMPWHSGPTILEYLESVVVDQSNGNESARFIVQSVTRAGGDFRGYAGFVASGRFTRGQEVLTARTGQVSRIARLITFDGDLDQADKGQAVTLELADHTDVGRGDVITPCHQPPSVTDQFAAHVVWFGTDALLPGRAYTMCLGAQSVTATVSSLRYRVQIETGEHIAAHILERNDIGSCHIATASPIALDPYAENRAMGAFILIDRDTAATSAAGIVEFSLHRASNVRRQSFEVDKAVRANSKNQRPCVIWFTGLPGAGKSTIMNLVDKKLTGLGLHTYALDGDNLRLGLTRDLGFTAADRVENIRRAAEVARLMVDAGLVVLCAFISPFQADRRLIRERLDSGEFVEVFVDTPLEVCMARDPKGLYAKAKSGKVRNVTGIDSPYERPEAPDIHLTTTTAPAELLADQVVRKLTALLKPLEKTSLP